MRAKAIGIGALCVSCGAGAIAASPVAPQPPRAPEPSPSASASAPPVDGGAPSELAARLCGDRTPCVVRRDRPAGAGLRVVSLDLGVHPIGADAPVGLEPPGEDVVETPTKDIIHPIMTFTHCRHLEYWLVSDSSKQLLLSTCNDGYGASGLGEDVIEVGDGTLAYDVQGGSAWRWGSHTELALAPLRTTRETWTAHWSVGPNVEEGEIDFTTFEGKTGWFSPICDANGEPPSDGAWGDDRYEYRLLPAVALDDAYRAGDG